MKHIRIAVIALLLVLTMLSASACGILVSERDIVAQIAGIWITTDNDTEENALIILQNLDFYEEEVALCDLTTLDYAKELTITEDKTYTFKLDSDGTRECVEQFLRDSFKLLYEGRGRSITFMRPMA